MPIHVGTSGWHYPTGRGTWNGVFYPAKRPNGFDELAYYATFFPTVEINATFYRMPEAALSARWMARTPSSFLFAVKLYQKFTHPDMYLAKTGVTGWDVTTGDLDEFRAGIDPIANAGRLAAVLLQFPPSFHADADTRAYLDWLGTALRTYTLAVELRHESWTTDAAETRAMLAARQMAWVRTDEPSIAAGYPIGADGEETSPLTYIRLHGRNTAAWWTHDHPEDRYNYSYSAGELAEVANAARRFDVPGRRVLVYHNNHFSAKAVANAAVLQRQLGDLMPGVFEYTMTERYPALGTGEAEDKFELRSQK